jgi:hypothetical protein
MWLILSLEQQNVPKASNHEVGPKYIQAELFGQ